jgi:hypothetical protein
LKIGIRFAESKAVNTIPLKCFSLHDDRCEDCTYPRFAFFRRSTAA